MSNSVSHAAFLQAKKKASNPFDSNDFWKDKHCDLLLSLGNVISSDYCSTYENLVNYYLVGHKRIEQLLKRYLPKVLIKIILEYVDLSRSNDVDNICWACCGGKLFLEPHYE